MFQLGREKGVLLKQSNEYKIKWITIISPERQEKK